MSHGNFRFNVYKTEINTILTKIPPRPRHSLRDYVLTHLGAQARNLEVTLNPLFLL